MSYRFFTDPSGITWLVLAVYPCWEDRRLERARRTGSTPARTERRSGSERRLRVRREMEAGWLLFKAEGGRRRLSPIVPGWDTVAGPQLVRLLEAAVPARRRGDPPPAALAPK